MNQFFLNEAIKLIIKPIVCKLIVRIVKMLLHF